MKSMKKEEKERKANDPIRLLTIERDALKARNKELVDAILLHKRTMERRTSAPLEFDKNLWNTLTEEEKKE